MTIQDIIKEVLVKKKHMYIFRKIHNINLENTLKELKELKEDTSKLKVIETFKQIIIYKLNRITIQ